MSLVPRVALGDDGLLYFLLMMISLTGTRSVKESGCDRRCRPNTASTSIPLYVHCTSSIKGIKGIMQIAQKVNLESCLCLRTFLISSRK